MINRRNSPAFGLRKLQDAITDTPPLSEDTLLEVMGTWSDISPETFQRLDTRKQYLIAVSAWKSLKQLTSGHKYTKL